MHASVAPVALCLSDGAKSVIRAMWRADTEDGPWRGLIVLPKERTDEAGT